MLSRAGSARPARRISFTPPAILLFLHPADRSAGRLGPSQSPHGQYGRLAYILYLDPVFMIGMLLEISLIS
jgi:hypothetical protein